MIKNTVKFGVILSVVLLSVRVGLSEVTVAETGPVVDRPWPIGSRAVIDFPTRFMWWTDPPMGGGRYHFHYSCTTTDEFNEMLEAFAVIQADRLELIVHAASGGESHWAFTVWDNEVWASNMNRIERTEPLFLPSSLRPPPAPRINLYADGPCFLLWEDVIVPPNITVVDRRTGPANLKQEIDRLKVEVARLRADIRQLQDLVLQLFQQMGLQ